MSIAIVKKVLFTKPELLMIKAQKYPFVLSKRKAHVDEDTSSENDCFDDFTSVNKSKHFKQLALGILHDDASQSIQ